MSRNRSYNPSIAGLATGLTGLNQGRGLDIVPSLSINQRKAFVPGSSDANVEPSLDVFYRVTPSLNASMTVNTDFSATEVDDRQVNLTRFNLFFPEKRDFFLNDADLFEFGRISAAGNAATSASTENNGRPFFSRRLGLSPSGTPVDLRYGGKLSGRVGRWTIGTLAVQQDDAASTGRRTGDGRGARRVRRTRLGQRARRVERRHDRDGRRSELHSRQRARRPRLPLPEHASSRRPRHAGRCLVSADRHRGVERRRFGVRPGRATAEQHRAGGAASSSRSCRRNFTPALGIRQPIGRARHGGRRRVHAFPAQPVRAVDVLRRRRAAHLVSGWRTSVRSRARPAARDPEQHRRCAQRPLQRHARGRDRAVHDLPRQCPPGRRARRAAIRSARQC